ncbi:MAG: DUF3567 family protein [Comamonadaceae bacterium]|nr:DUF3567 family protein [Comamonadaceae bacterium]
MQMLYDSDSFVVLHLKPDLGLPAEVTLADGQTPAPAMPRHGFAELFQQQIQAWQQESPTEEEVEDILERYAQLAQNPVLVH